MSTIRYEMLFYPTTKNWKTEKKLKIKRTDMLRYVNSPGICVVSPEEEKEGYDRKDSQKRKVLSPE